MVNTLSGSVSAYRKEIVKPRFIRIDEVMALLDVTRDEAMDIALSYQSQKRRMMRLMGWRNTRHIRKLSKRILSMMPYYSAIRTRRMLYKESLT